MTIEAETIIRDGTDNPATLWSDLQTLWTQYQSWQQHEQLLSDRHDQLSGASTDTAKELQSLLGDQDEFTLAGQKLQAALTERLNALENPTCQTELTRNQQLELAQIRTRLSREMELRSLGNVDRDYDRER